MTFDVRRLVRDELAAGLTNRAIPQLVKNPADSVASVRRDQQIGIVAWAQVGSGIVAVREMSAFDQQRRDACSVECGEQATQRGFLSEIESESLAGPFFERGAKV